MEDAVEALTRGNVTEVKVLLTSVLLALGAYQLVLIAVGYGRLRPSFLAARPAARSHRAIGDTIVAVLVVVAVMCLAVGGLGDDGGAHAVTGAALLAVLAAKVLVVRRDLGLGRFLPVFGTAVFLLLCATWALSAGAFLGG